jgi:3-dehydroquinate dehydratase
VAEVLVLAPLGAHVPPNARRALRIARYRNAPDLIAALAGTFECAVLWSDGLHGSELEAVATAVRECERPVIEVESERWDGFSHSPLSAACKGVISGFGFAGVEAAAHLLRHG